MLSDGEIERHAVLLGVNPYNLHEAVLKSAYLKAAQSAHPDRGGSEQHFQAVSRAYEALKQHSWEQQYYESSSVIGNHAERTIHPPESEALEWNPAPIENVSVHTVTDANFRQMLRARSRRTP